MAPKPSSKLRKNLQGAQKESEEGMRRGVAPGSDSEWRFTAGIVDEKDNATYFNAGAERRRNARQFFRQLEATQEWAENNYYHVPKEQRNGSLVQVNAFWRDYAAAEPGKPFFSGNVV